MNTEIELRKWLNRSNLNFVENLDFGIKVWNSIEFVLLTKQEIIVDEFCNNLPKLRVELKTTSDVNYAELAWSKINEFLSLRYSAGAVSVAIKAKLIKVLSKEAKANNVHQAVAQTLAMNALLITLHNTSMQNYYKSNAKEFAKFLATNVSYLTTLVKQVNGPELNEERRQQRKEQFDKTLSALKAFIKQTPFLDVFKSAFTTEILQVLSELVILMKSRGIDYTEELLVILQELFFDGSQTNVLKRFFANKKAEHAQEPALKEYTELFNVPMHVFLTVAEAALLSYRNDVEVQRLFFQYLFNDVAGKLNCNDNDVQTQIICLTYFIRLLKKHDVPLNFEIVSMKAFTYLGQRIETIVNSHHSNYVYAVLNLVCATLKLNPLILENSACQIGVKFMVIAKSDEAVWQKYDEFMFLLIEMYRKLSRAEKFISQLIRNLYETLSTMKLSKKLKRSLNNSAIVSGATPSKRVKSAVDEAIPADGIEIDRVGADGEINFVTLLEQNILSESDGSTAQLPHVSKNRSNQCWNDIAFAFTPAVSHTYTRFIAGLVSKPSLVVWKTLIYTLKDYVQQLNDSDGKSSENSIFLIEITSALLSQYFMGSRLAEQADKMWSSIEANRKLTYDVLADFGHAILNQEHNYRTMNAFLKLCHNASNFDLVCWYYCPDSMNPDNNADDVDMGSDKINGLKCAQNIHAYLTEKEWTIIEQRITNFGKRECKSNINKIYLQRLKALQLFGAAQPAATMNVSKYLLSLTFDDVEQISGILHDDNLSTWFIGNLDGNQKRVVCELLLQSQSGIDIFTLLSVNDREFIDILTISSYKRLIEILANGKNSDYLSTIDFESIVVSDTDAVCGQLNSFIERHIIGQTTADRKHIQKSHAELANLLRLLNTLPIGFGKQNTKHISLLLNIIVYGYLMASGSTELCAAAINIFKTLLHFDEFPPIFNSLKVETLITLFRNETNAQPIYDIIFDRICKDLTDANRNVLENLLLQLQQFEQCDQSQQKTLLDLAVLAIANLFKNKRNKEYFDRFRAVLFDIIKKIASDKDSVEWCIAKALPAFATIVKTFIGISNVDSESKKTDADVAQIFKLFLQNSVDCKNQYSIRLLNIALENKTILNLADDELKRLIDRYWVDFKDACANAHDEATIKTMGTALKMIFDFKSTDDWIELLTEVEKEIESSIFSDKVTQQSKILASMAKCQYNKAKGQIFTGFLKNIAYKINLTIRTKSTDLTQNFDWTLSLLECYTIFTNNVQIPVSVELIDDMLSLLTEINVKNFNVDKFDPKHFVRLLNQMIELCLGLIKHRPVFVMDRVPHFVNVFKDLLQTICWYKSDRSQQVQLEQAEVTMLAEMAHNLEKMNKYFVKHSTEVKRVAPYLLVFVINLMISNDRPTTLYAKIKTHIEYICYDLIATCDHRSNSFILRSCNEASKPVYENLHKEYEKYFKFKGKV